MAKNGEVNCKKKWLDKLHKNGDKILGLILMKFRSKKKFKKNSAGKKTNSKKKFWILKKILSAKFCCYKFGIS